MPPKPKQAQVPPAKLNEFMNVSGCTDRSLAETLLVKTKMNVNDAVEEFFNGNYAQTHGKAPQVDSKEVEAEFERYNDGNNAMESNGIMSFFEKAGVSMEDILVFIFSFECKAQNMGVFTKEEFVRGMAALGIAKAEDLGKRGAEFKARYKPNTPAFNDFFKFVFPFATGGKKSIPAEEASALLGIVAKGLYPIADKFIHFLASDASASKELIYKDTWTMIHHLFKTTSADGQGFNQEDAWPLLIINFMESVKKA